jgi:hypothetical protein
MVTTGLIVRLTAKEGKVDELAAFLRDALPLVQEEPDTIAWRPPAGRAGCRLNRRGARAVCFRLVSGYVR